MFQACHAPLWVPGSPTPELHLIISGTEQCSLSFPHWALGWAGATVIELVASVETVSLIVSWYSTVGSFSIFADWLSGVSFSTCLGKFEETLLEFSEIYFVSPISPVLWLVRKLSIVIVSLKVWWTEGSLLKRSRWGLKCRTNQNRDVYSGASVLYVQRFSPPSSSENCDEKQPV